MLNDVIMTGCRRSGIVACLLFVSAAGVVRGDDLFVSQMQPFLRQHCLHCHGEDLAESGIRLDRLDGTLPEQRLRLWENIRRQIDQGTMPPEEEDPATPAQRQAVVAWMDAALEAARRRPDEYHGSIRRLTRSQYRNSLQDLLGIDSDLTAILPPDAVSRDGFTNNADAMLLTPRQLEAYLAIAEQALDLCLVDETQAPQIQRFQMKLGQEVNSHPCPDELILGARSALLPNTDFEVTQPALQKSFDFEPVRMRTAFRFLEGYQGNDTVRGWREYDSIYHAVFACVRGTKGYPKGTAWQTVPEGLLLRPAVPSAELFQVESTYGPKANFKISLRELPEQGRFRVTVRAARYNDGLLLEAGDSVDLSGRQTLDVDLPDGQSGHVTVGEAGVYLVRVLCDEAAAQPQVQLQLGPRFFAGQLQQPEFLVLRLPAGELSVQLDTQEEVAAAQVELIPLTSADAVSQRFEEFEQRPVFLGVHLGLRRDCGSTLSRVGQPRAVTTASVQEFQFFGTLRDFPSPDVEPGNVNYLAGLREIGVRSEYTDGRDRSRLLIESVDFEGPYYESWPPQSHRQIFIPSPHAKDSEEYARQVILSFAERAWRRPLIGDETAQLMRHWCQFGADTADAQQRIRRVLVVVLTAPQFLCLADRSDSPQPELLSPHELVSRLSYFLWNSPPDEELLRAAQSQSVDQILDRQFERMLSDTRFSRMTEPFVSEWLSLDKLDVVELDRERFPRLTRDVRAELRQEPVRFVEHLIRANLPVQHLVQSDLVMVNEVLADYYELPDGLESGFEFVPVRHRVAGLGGVLTQAGVLAGLSDGREPNPVKRGAWLARKIIAEPPADPPPNVPALMEDDDSLTLRQKLERHRNQKGCVKCHEGIDPWGLPFEQYDAGGRLRNAEADAASQLPDGTMVAGVADLQTYLAQERIDQVAFSVARHLLVYAVGRRLTYNETESVRALVSQHQDAGYPLKDLLRSVVHSQAFLMK